MPHNVNHPSSHNLTPVIPSSPAAAGAARNLLLVATAFLLCFLASCSRPSKFDPASLTFLIESNPVNLDPRFATDGQSQRLDGLIFSGLLARDAQMNLHGDLAESWQTSDPLTYIFHLKPNIKFHDGRPLTSADVKSTFDFILNPANKSPKRGAFRMVAKIDAPDALTVIFHLKEPYASFLVNLIPNAAGIVPANASLDFARHPVGSGPFQFVSQAQDEDVQLIRNANYFHGAPWTEFLHFRIVPDAVVRALELRKGSADLEMSSLSPDLVPVLVKQPNLALTQRPGTNFAYLGINLQDPLLARKEVRQALAFATDRSALIRYLLHGQAQVASGILPPNHWAYEPNVAQYALDAARAEKLLDEAGFPRKQNGVRFHLLLKTSTEEQARLIGAALQEQWRKVGIDLELRPLELATLLSDAARGNFQLTYARWVGANNDPDIFEFVASSRRFPPDGANRGHYRCPRVDALTDQIHVEPNQEKRKLLCSEVQQILAEDLPYIPLWFTDVVSIHRRELGDLPLSPTGDYDFLTSLKPSAPPTTYVAH
ncbi:MAG TPA: ABC transporter substrate-binding protein [Candidatus Eisenbacteria bacterium]|jgi:peptide/nickel transport system substrate-binding protein|nr:ABC transporter substrate-binding protein [Candidatus Eisenbacteria bacterium]